MKKLLLLTISCALLLTSFGQTTSYKKGHALGVSFFLNDFKTAAEIRSNGLVSVLKANDIFKTSRMDAGMAINYLSGLSEHVDFIGTLGGSFVSYSNSNIPFSSSTNLLSEVTASLNLKLLTLYRSWCRSKQV
jgi:OOP family OmpA-OmpF porin